MERNVQLVFREDVDRAQRLRSRQVNERLVGPWADFAAQRRTPRSLLSAGSRLICPRPEMDGPADGVNLGHV